MIFKKVNNGKILLIDDDPVIIDILIRIFAGEQHLLMSAYTAEEGYAQIKDHNPDVIIVDYNLSTSTGCELITRAKNEYGNNAFVIMISGFNDEKIRKICYEAGANLFLPKPFSNEELRLIVKNNIMLKMTADLDGPIMSMLTALHHRDHWSGGHSRRVAKLALLLGKEICLSDKEIGQIETAAKLHDIGKIGIPDEILLKNGPLSETERIHHINLHPVNSKRILEGINLDNKIIDAIQYHHERYDGTGYPNGLKGDNIPFEARLIAIVDAFDAMKSKRPYHDERSQSWVRQEMINGAGEQHCPNLLEHFLSISPIRIEEIYQ